MNQVEDLERQMREALGVAPKKVKTTREVSNPMRGYLIVLSVRGASGPAFRFEHRSRSLSRTEAILEAEAGIHLSDSKRSLVASRLARRLRHFGFDSYGEYLDHLQRHDPDGVERQVMIECMTTNKTDFFREPHHFTFLGEVAAPLWRSARRLA